MRNVMDYTAWSMDAARATIAHGFWYVYKTAQDHSFEGEKLILNAP
jgi:hypothetical protein